MQNQMSPFRIAVTAFLLVLALGAGAAYAQVNAYVASPDTDSVLVLETATNTVTTAIPVFRPRQVTYSPDGHFVYASTYDGVAKINTATNTVVGTVTINPTSAVFDIAVTANGATAYAGDYENDAVAVIDTATMTVIATLPAFRPEAVETAPDGTTIWVSSSATPDYSTTVIAVIDSETNTFTTFPLDTDRPVVSIAFTPDGAFAYLTFVVRDVVAVIDTANQTQVATLDPGSAAAFIAVAPDGELAYVTTSKCVVVIDTATNTVVNTIALGRLPLHLAITPDGSRVYVTDQLDNTVSVIDTATRTVLTTVYVPKAFGIALPSRQDVDQDDDGVLDVSDNCPFTPTGQTVDPATGCSIAQLCPCVGPRDTTQPWKNHGQYVSCVAKSAQSFLQQGLITSTQKDAIVSSAGRSACGKHGGAT